MADRCLSIAIHAPRGVPAFSAHVPSSTIVAFSNAPHSPTTPSCPASSTSIKSPPGNSSATTKPVRQQHRIIRSVHSSRPRKLHSAASVLQRKSRYYTVIRQFDIEAPPPLPNIIWPRLQPDHLDHLPPGYLCPDNLPEGHPGHYFPGMPPYPLLTS